MKIPELFARRSPVFSFEFFLPKAPEDVEGFLENVRGLMEKPDVNGALVGGASLKADSFLKIARG